MSKTPADLLESLSRLDELLGEDVRDTLTDDIAQAMTQEQLITFGHLTESVGRRADALRVTAAAEIDERSRPELGEERLSARHGCANAVEMLCRITRVSSATARARVRQGHAVATRRTLTGEPLPALFPSIREAMTDGAIGLDSIAAVTSVLSPIAERCDPMQWAAAEYELTAASTGQSEDGAPACTADDTRLQAKVWELVLDPDGALPVHERAALKRGISFGPERDGIRAVRGGVLAEVYEQFRLIADAVLNPRVDDLPDASGNSFADGVGATNSSAGDSLPDDTAATDASIGNDSAGDASGQGAGTAGVRFRESAEGPDEPVDTRTHPQKLHDVLAMILGVAGRSADMPTIGGAAPAVVITIDADDIDCDDGVGFINGTDCTVPAFVARHAACNAGTQHMVLASDGRIIELGSPNRTFTPHQRRAINARDGECVIPGCHVRASWCEVHHVIPHAQGGPTHVDNGVPLCWWHHRTIDTSGWEIRMVDGLPEVRAPRSIDPDRRWRPTAGSLHRARNRLRRRVGGRRRSPRGEPVRRT
jgi:hypothetical protein